MAFRNIWLTGQLWITSNVSFLPFRTLIPYPALQNGHSQFVINGNWKISIPGEYNVAGTKLVYRRSADTWESFEVPGPTQEDLHLMVRALTYWCRMVRSAFGRRSWKSLLDVSLILPISEICLQDLTIFTAYKQNPLKATSKQPLQEKMGSETEKGPPSKKMQ